MLIDPAFIVANPGPVAAIVALVVVGKGLITTAVPLLFGYPARMALLVGASLAQVGEFSFVLLQQGVALGLVTDQINSLTLSAALLTILLTPFLLHGVEPLHRVLLKLPVLGPLVADPVVPRLGAETELRRHAVICGFGRVGGELSEALARRGFQYLVIELDLRRVQRLQQRGIPVIYGDATNPEVLKHARLEHAQVLAAALPDARASELLVRQARAINPRLDIIARAAAGELVPRLRQAGADEVVHPQFEAGLEFVRHVLQRYGVSSREIELITSRRRIAHYTPQPGDETAIM
jgi:CPA2 family monovalent cation:H+ antiporter-2